MTDLAKRVMWYMDSGFDTEQMLAAGIGESAYQLDFIVEQIKIARGQ